MTGPADWRQRGPEFARASDVYCHARIVPSDDIDVLGHASNVAYVRWVQDAAVAHSESVGLGIEAYLAFGAVFVVRRHELDYLRSAMSGDAIVLETWIEAWSAATSTRRTRVLRGEEELAHAVTTWAFIDRTTGRPARVPDAVKAAFADQKDHDASPCP